MSISDAALADLYNGLSEILSPSQTETLMSVARLQDQLATKADLAGLETRLEARMDARFDEFRIEMRAELRSMKESFDRRIDRVFIAIAAMPVAIVAAMAAIFG